MVPFNLPFCAGRADAEATTPVRTRTAGRLTPPKWGQFNFAHMQLSGPRGEHTTGTRCGPFSSIPLGVKFDFARTHLSTTGTRRELAGSTPHPTWGSLNEGQFDLVPPPHVRPTGVHR